MTLKYNLSIIHCFVLIEVPGAGATYVLSNLVSELILPTAEPLHFECLFVKISFHQNKYITGGNVYRPPSFPAETSSCLISTINSLSCKNELIILGDFLC